MHAQVLILSSDEMFARMLAVELEMQRLKVLCKALATVAHRADLVLLDLDSALPPPVDCYRYMIGFSRNSEGEGEEIRRRCSLVLRRPFEMRQLREEVLSLLENGERSPAWASNGYTVAELFENEGAGGSARLSDGRQISLSPKEYSVLRLLMEHRGKVVSREAISAAIGESSANKADVYICFLRKKLETSETRLIQTMRGSGYTLL